MVCIAIAPAHSASVESIKWVRSPDSLDFQIRLSDRVAYTISDHITRKGYFSVQLKDISSNYGNRWIDVNNIYLRRVKVDSARDTLRLTFYPQVLVRYSVHYDRANMNFLHISLTPVVKKRSNSKIIVLDPGHGGKSRGARSAVKINGSYVWEKDLVLDIAYKLKRLIDLSPDYIACMTRTDDRYLGLTDRIKYAQKMGGDLFISIHCNAVGGYRSSKARGIEFFHWSERGSEHEAVRFLERIENEEHRDCAAPDNNGELKAILTTLFKEELEERKRESRDFCKILNASFCQYPYFREYNRGIKKARFKVLANHMMPSVLVELGFMSNKSEIYRLVDEEFQWQACKAMFASIRKYFSYDFITASTH